MAITKTKGSIAEAKVIADLVSRGYKVSIPFGEDQPYDLILDNGTLLRVQVKYVESDGKVIHMSLRCINNWSITVYTPETVDCMAVYDKMTDRCYYVLSEVFGDNRAMINLRLKAPKNKQAQGIRWAEDFMRI